MTTAQEARQSLKTKIDQARAERERIAAEKVAALEAAKAKFDPTWHLERFDALVKKAIEDGASSTHVYSSAQQSFDVGELGTFQMQVVEKKLQELGYGTATHYVAAVPPNGDGYYDEAHRILVITW